MAREGWCPIATANGGGSAFIEFYGIPNTYEHLCIRGLVSSDSSDSFPIYYYMYFNTTTSGYDVSSNSTSYAGGSRDTQANFNGTASPTAGRNINPVIGNAGNTTTHGVLGYGMFEAEIFNYKNTDKYTTVNVASSYATQNTSGATLRYQVSNRTNTWRNTSAVTSMHFVWENLANWTTASKITLYGFLGGE
tara:strand:+ start:601 stop:1176 length:576 start_codon:yes stop_codon:yes gene_type:complete